jgi:hypothetical protein
VASRAEDGDEMIISDLCDMERWTLAILFKSKPG